MSKERPLISDAQIARIVDSIPTTGSEDVYMERAAMAVRGMYESARAKDHELIQMLVDALHKEQFVSDFQTSTPDTTIEALAAAAEAGYRPKP